MIAVLDSGATLRAKAAVVRAIEAHGLHALIHSDGGGEHETRIGVLGPGSARIADLLSALEGVTEVQQVASPYPLVDAATHGGRKPSIRIGDDLRIGQHEDIAIIAGPCAVESREQILTASKYVKRHGGHALRGGAFKPRTSPYSFQGLGIEGLELLRDAREATGLPIVTEVVAVEDVDAVAEHADLLQLGARNMQNFRLLEACGAQSKPVLLKRGLIATLDELLHAAEYIAAAGNPNVILCERGIRTHEPATRNTLDVAAIPWLKQRSHLPVIVDPSHACGVRELVLPLALAGLAAGADGLIVETHPNPEVALSDKEQALTEADFQQLIAAAGPVAVAVGRRLAGSSGIA